MKSLFLTRDQVLSLWSGSTDSKTLDYQRTNPTKYQIVELTQRKPLEYKTWYHPTTSSTLCRMPHSKQQTKQKYSPNYQQTGLPTHSALPIRVKTNKQPNKLSTNLTLCEAHTNHWTNCRRAEMTRKKELNILQGKKSIFLEAWAKETSNTIT